MNTPYYIFDADSFIENYKDLEREFRSFYPNYHIAYSFKTNYTPAVCKIVLELGGYAEVVSDMEYELALRIGFPNDHIIYNGPGKQKCIKNCLQGKGLLNIDNKHEAEIVCELGKTLSDLSVGIRVNFDVGNGLHSRFGLDILNGDLEETVKKLNDSGIKVSGLHFHISRARNIESWKKRIDTLLIIADRVEAIQGSNLNYIDIGSGMYGKLGDKLKAQFTNVPTYHDYADVVAGTMAKHYLNREDKPMLFSEPGTTLVSKYFSLYSQVIDIKTIRDKSFALLDCSIHNVGEICGLKRVPIEITNSSNEERDFDAIDFVGYTCLEQDVIYHDFKGKIAVGDIVEFENVGGYSIVDKPPFIHPDIPIYMDREGKRSCVKRAQTIDDIFAPYVF